MTSNPYNQAKVRVACQRCRARRVKCDGGVPSCANCAKAGTACVDVDARNAERLIPRNAAAQAKARIKWLEDIIAQSLPSVDLSSGPQLDLDCLGEADLAVYAPELRSHVTENAVSNAVEGTLPSGPLHAVKRSYDTLADSSHHEAFSNEARSVAHDLGRLSLNADSREKHYLGSSSGLIFSYLVQTGSPAAESDQSSARPRPFSARHRQVEQDYSSTYETLKISLPSKDDALHLFEIFLCHVYPDHPVLHLQSVLHAIDALYDCRDLGEAVHLDYSGWPEDMIPFAYNGELEAGSRTPITLPTAMFHVFMLFTIAASVKVGGVQNEFAPARFYRVATAVAPDVLGETSIASLQAVYLMALHAFMTPVKLNIWTLTYVCMAHSVDLGIHRQLSQAPPTVQVIRALLFYSVYSLDRSVATIQGRPLGIRDETFDAQLPALESLRAEIDSQKIPVSYVQLAQGTSHYILHRFRLDKIVSQIKSVFYFLPSETNQDIWSVDHDSHKARLHIELNSWYSNIADVSSILPVHDPEKQRWRLHLEQLYYAAVVLLFQPSQIYRKPDAGGLRLCCDAAVQQILCYNSIYEQDMLQFDWRTVRNIFACGATIIYCFWTSDTISASSLCAQMANTLRMCTSLLAVGGIWWPSVKKSKSGFERLVDLSLRRVNDMQMGDTERSHKRRAPRPITTVEASSREAANFDNTGRHLPSQALRQQNSQGRVYEAMSQLANYDHPIQDFGMNTQWSAAEMSYPPADEFQNSTFAVTSDQGEASFYEPNNSTSSHYYVEPEIAAFLTDYFLDDSAWDASIAGPSLSFHFGDL